MLRARFPESGPLPFADLHPLNDWTGPSATLTLWRPSATSIASAGAAAVSPVQPSYEQEQHLRAYCACELRQEEMARILVVAWDEAGECDLAVMGQVVAAHVRRHDTYHSWFEERGDAIVRRVLADPALIEMEAVTVGEVTAEDWRRCVASTPSPFNWDCFRFGVLQRSAGFTCFAGIDHLHADSSVIAFLMDEIHGQYCALMEGKSARLARPGRYLDYCSSQRRRAASMTLADPEVREWVDFLRRNQGRMPQFPLPLGVVEDRCVAEYLHVDVLDRTGMATFEHACQAAGARVIGGLLACAAMAGRELAEIDHFGVVTPTTTRKSPRAFRTAGWCMGVVPIDFDVRARSFPELAVSLQRVFGERSRLAHVPVERVLELATGLPGIRPVATGGVMLSYMNMKRFALGAQIADDWQTVNGRTFISQGMAAQVALWFFHTRDGLTLTVSYPGNATARISMGRYLKVLLDTCRRVAIDSKNSSVSQ